MSKPTIPILIGAAMVAAVLLAPGRAPAQVLTGAPLPVINAPPAGELARSYDAAELERILSPIALYPDPLLAQVLSAAAYANEIPVAMQWVDARRGRSAEQLVDMLALERVTWDPSVQALVAFPTVLHMMATSMPWTAEVGDAFRAQRADVMDAVQRLRGQAQRYGYLRTTSALQVVQSRDIEILPVNPSYVVVPYYDPLVVFVAPRPRHVVSSAIYLGFGVRLGYWYEPWGWRSSGFYWPSRHIVGGYPGWNRPHRHRPVYVDYRRDDPRYGGRPPQVWDRDNDRGRPRDVQRRDDDGARARDRWSNPGNTGRGSREAASTGRTAQPRSVERVVERVERAPAAREVQRTNPQPSPGGSTEPRVARRRN